MKKGIIFISPLLILFVSFTLLDVFKIYKKFDNYNDTFINLNRDYICYKTFKKYSNKENFNSFIFGSSLSLSFTLQNWSKHLPEDAKPFHFDGAGTGLYGIYKKIRFIDNNESAINNALVIIDRRALVGKGLQNGETHYSISPPEISGESQIDFYWMFIKKGLDFKFVAAYIDYSLFGTYRDYMGWYIEKSKFRNYSDPVNCDFKAGYEAEIKEDSLGYYKKLIDKGVFYNRPIEDDGSDNITELEIKYLEGIQEIFEKHNTNYKIVIPPTYDQIPLDHDQLNLMYQIFGIENVYNFSGKNKYTEPISNFFESDHYKPYVANEIMEIIYGDIHFD